MGLSASQARFLALTAQKSDLEYEAQQIANSRVKLADSTDEVQKKYSEKLNNTVLKFKSTSTEGYIDLTHNEFQTNSAFSNYFLTDLGGKIIVSSSDDIPKDITEKERLKYTVDERLKDNAYFADSLKNGVYFLTTKESDGQINQKSIAGIAFVQETYDESDDDSAKVEYDREMKRLQKEDKKLEMELDRIETAHKAIETEMESVQKVIDQDIENSFKTFS